MSACETDATNVSAATDAVLPALKDVGFDYALIGLAVILRGHDRYTSDVDALVRDLADRLVEFASLLPKHGFRTPATEQLRLSKSTRILLTIWQEEAFVDFMLGLFPIEREILDHATAMDLGQSGLAKVATPEDLVIMKLTASREMDAETRVSPNDVMCLDCKQPRHNGLAGSCPQGGFRASYRPCFQASRRCLRSRFARLADCGGQAERDGSCCSTVDFSHATPLAVLHQRRDRPEAGRPDDRPLPCRPGRRL